MDINDFNFPLGKRDWYIAKYLLDGHTREETLRHFFRSVGKSNRWTYRENPGGGSARQAKPIREQYSLFFYTVSKVINEMIKAGWSSPESTWERNRWTSKSREWVAWRQAKISELLRESESPPFPPAQDFTQKPRPSASAATGTGFVPTPSIPNFAEIKPPEEVIQPFLPEDVVDDYGNLVTSYEYNKSKTEVIVTNHSPRPTKIQRYERFYKLLMKARSFVLERELSGQYLDFISTRALWDGCKAIKAGISENEIMEAITKTWPKDSKRELETWHKTWEPTPLSSINWEDYPADLPNAHRFLGYVMRLAEARVPVFLVGPSGCGKSFLARDLAIAIGTEYGELPLTAGATPSWLVGAETITGYKSRPFVEIYREGGVFCFEEMDAADPNMLLLINNALANDFLMNPVTGEEIEKHEDFIPIATANTWGLGANRQFTGRERLDAATLDRWRVGRVEMDYDQAIEKGIVSDFIKLAEKGRARKVRVKKAVRHA